MDHVPPKTIFEPHDQSNLITVPCCRPCNQSASKDDQYFLLFVALCESASQKSEHERLWQKALRTLRRKEASTFRQKVTSKIKFVQPITPAGIILPSALSIPIDGLRVIGAVIRIVKGLYFHETRRRLPETHRVIAYDELALLLALRNATPGRAKDLSSIRDLIGNVQTTLRKTVGKVFAYHWASNPTDAATSMWLLDFFDGIRFFCVTQPTGNNLLTA